MTFVINILLDNDYPLTFIFDTVNQRIKNLIKNRHMAHKDLVDNICANESASWLTVPFIPLQKNLSDSIKTTSGFLSIVLIKWINILKYRRIFVPIHLRAMKSIRYRVIIVMRRMLDRRADN